MINYFDWEYKETKLIKQGKKQLSYPFADLAKWISSTWEVVVLNVIYDAANDLHAPRLQIILEHKDDAEVFEKSMKIDLAKKNAITRRFSETFNTDRAMDFDTEGLFVVYSAFAPLAIEEADNQISDKEVEDLKRKIGNPDFWTISRNFGRATFFFFTDEQIRQNEDMGKKAEYTKLYLNLLKVHDEFDYLDESTYTIEFDSKQNFDETYNGSWFSYYR